MDKMHSENIIKNLIITLLLIPGYFLIKSFFVTNPVVNDRSALGIILSCVSILSVTACFGNFAFTYEKVEPKNIYSRMIAHFTTGLLMLIIGLTLEMTSVILSLLVSGFFIFDISLTLLYVASVLYDFWDLRRVEK
jgi:hypothetical protein